MPVRKLLAVFTAIAVLSSVVVVSTATASPGNPNDVIIDNFSDGYQESLNTWTTSTAGSSYGGSHRWPEENDAWASYTPQLREGAYRVYSYAPHIGTANAVMLAEIYSASGEVKVTYSLTTGTTGWRDLGVYWFKNGNGKVVLSANNKGIARFDAVRFERVAGTWPETVIDYESHKQGEYGENGTWSNSTAGVPYNGSQRFLVSSTGYTYYAPKLPFAGTYDVYAYQPYYDTSNTNKMTVDVKYAGGAAQVNYSEETGTNGTWYKLGTWPFKKNGALLSFSGDKKEGGQTDANTVRVDAVKFVPVNGPEFALVSPADTQQAQPGAPILITLGQSMDVATVTADKFTLRDSASNSIPFSMEVENDGEMVKLTPQSPLSPSSSYTVEIASGISDPLGNISGAATLSFATAAQDDNSTAAGVISQPPASTGISITDSFLIDYDKDLDANTVSWDNVNIKEHITGADIPAAVALKAPNSIVIYPKDSLKPLTIYDINVNGVKDTAGNAVMPISDSYKTSGNVLTVDNTDAGFSYVGPAPTPQASTAKWKDPATNQDVIGYVGSNFFNINTPQGYAKYSFSIPDSGVYEVFVNIPYPGSNNGDGMYATIIDTAGSTNVPFSMKTAQRPGYYSLGQFTFTAGGTAEVSIHATTWFRTDAVRLVQLSGTNTAPTVVGFTPPADKTALIVLDFNKPVNTYAFNQQTVKLFDMINISSYRLNLIWDGTRTKLKIDPLLDLDTGLRYVLEISGNITDSEGNALTGQRRWDFIVDDTKYPQISQPTLKNADGTDLTALTPGNDIKAAVSINNPSDAMVKCYLVVAVYSPDGKMLLTKISPRIDVNIRSQKSAELALTLPAGCSGGKVKAFVWRKFLNIYPLKQPTAFTAQQ